MHLLCVHTQMAQQHVVETCGSLLGGFIGLLVILRACYFPSIMVIIIILVFVLIIIIIIIIIISILVSSDLDVVHKLHGEPLVKLRAMLCVSGIHPSGICPSVCAGDARRGPVLRA